MGLACGIIGDNACNDALDLPKLEAITGSSWRRPRAKPRAGMIRYGVFAMRSVHVDAHFHIEYPPEF